MVTKRTIFLLLLLTVGSSFCFDAEVLEDDADDVACCQETSGDDRFCYVGSLDLKRAGKQAKRWELGYDGTLVPVVDGVYCFKEQADVEKFYLLFVDPEAIQFVFCGKTYADNTVNHLSFVSNTAYHLYRLKRSDGADGITWDIKRKPMEKQEVNGQTVVLIPDHTLIIPLPSDFFKKTERCSILFTYKALKNGRVVKLPTPVVAMHDKDKVQEALIKAQLCMINFKNMHTKQEVREVNLDKHRLLQ